MKPSWRRTFLDICEAALTLIFAVLIVLSLTYSFEAVAQTYVSPDCRFTWNAPTTGGPVQGYMIYLEQQTPYVLQNFDAGMNLQYDCAQANLTRGSWKAWITAYNVVGESAPSNSINFTLLVSAPGSPTGVSVGEILNP